MKTTVPFFCFPLALLFVSVTLLSSVVARGQTNAWINEIHYDNVGADQNEGVEIIIENPGNLSDYRLDLYNGSNGLTYSNETVDAISAGAVIGNFQLFYWNQTGIQNDMDGVALSYQGTVIQFLSYEGSFTANDGPANTMVSIDIGVSEGNSTTATQSMQLQGAGNQYSSFTWASNIESTFGLVNSGQVLQGGGNLPPSISNVSQSPEAGNVTSSDAVVVTAQIADSDGVGTVTLNYGNSSGNLNVPVTMTPSAGDIYSATIPAQPNGTTVFYQIVAADLAVPPAVATSLEGSYTVQDPIPAPTLLISEVADPSDEFNARFVELYNNGPQSIDFASTVVVLARFSNGNTSAQNVQLEGILPAGAFYTIAYDEAIYTGSYGLTPSMESGIINGNGDDVYALYVGGDEMSGTLFDIYGEIGVGGTGEPWEYEDAKAIRNSTSGSPSATWNSSEWTITNADVNHMTPGYKEADFVFDGSWVPANPVGLATSADDIRIIEGNAVFNSDVTANTVFVLPNASLAVEAILTLHGDIINHNGSLVFTSTATANGELAALPSGATIQGEITVERHMSAHRAYRLVSSPVTTTTSIRSNWQEGVNNPDTATQLNPNPGFGTHITGSVTGAQGFDASGSGNVSMFTVNVPAQSFVPVSNTDVNTLVGGTPYLLFVRGDRSIDLTDNNAPPTETVLRATGTLSTGTVQQTYTVSATGDFIAFGNPYQSSVDMSAVLSGHTDVNPNFYYVYDPTLGDNGSYTTIDLSTNTATNGSAANRYLQPGQVGQVEAISTGSVSLWFEQTDKAPGNHTPTFTPVTLSLDNEYVLSASLYSAANADQDETLHDSFLIRFAEGYTNERTLADAKKPWNFNENLGSVLEGVPYSIQRRALPEGGEELPVAVNQYRHTDYVMKVQYTAIPNRIAWWVDQFGNTTTELVDGETILPFSVDAAHPQSAAEDRFYIVFEEEMLGLDSNTMAEVRMYPNPLAENTVNFALPEAMLGQSLQVQITDLRGRMVVDQGYGPTQNSLRVALPNVDTGVYMVRLLGEHGYTTFRLVKE